MLAARFEIEVHTDSGLNDFMIGEIMERLEQIDFESLILSRFYPQEISKYGITVEVPTA